MGSELDGAAGQPSDRSETWKKLAASQPTATIAVVGVVLFAALRGLDERYFLKLQISPQDAGRDYVATLMDLAGAVPLVFAIFIGLVLGWWLIALVPGFPNFRKGSLVLLIPVAIGSLLAWEGVAAYRGPCSPDSSVLRSAPSIVHIDGPNPPAGDRLVYLGTGPDDRIVVDCGADPLKVYRLPASQYSVVTSG